MWVIQILDGKPGLLYLREFILDGRIISFDKEEGALRFMNRVKEKAENILSARLRTVRFSGDPRKDKPYKVPEGSVDELAEYISSYFS